MSGPIGPQVVDREGESLVDVADEHRQLVLRAVGCDVSRWQNPWALS